MHDQPELLTEPEQQSFEAQVRAPLRRLGRQIRGYLLLDGLTRWAGLAGLLLVAQVLLDYALSLRLDMRAVALAAVVGALAAYGYWRVIRPAVRTLPVDDLAVIVQRRFPGLGDRLVTAVQLAGDWGAGREACSTALARAVIRQAAADLPEVKPSAALNHGHARRQGGLLWSLAAVVAGSTLLWPEVFAIAFQRNLLLADVPWPQQTTLRVLEFSPVVARGDRMVVLAEALGVVPRQVFAERRLGQSSERLQLRQVGGNRFRAELAALQEDFTFRLLGGDAMTEWLAVRVVDRPAVIDAQVSVQPPAYADIEPPHVPRGQTVVEVLPGSRVALAITTNKPLTHAWLCCGQDRLAEATAIDPTHFALHLAPQQTTSLSFELRDRDGLSGLRSVRFSIRLRPDRPPAVKLRMPGVGELITPQAELPIELTAEDQYGLAWVELVWEVAGSGQPLRRRAVEGLQPRARRFDRRWTLAAGEFGAEAGDRLTIYAESADLDDVNGPNVGRSVMTALRMVTREDLLNALTRREQEARQVLEQVAADQEQVRAELLAVLDAIRRGASPGQAEKLRLAKLERLERQLGPRTATVAQQIEGLLAEMRVNQVSNPSIRKRLGAGVAGPLAELARQYLPAAADALDAAGQELAGETLQRADDQLRAILQSMRSVLANMLKWESYNEAVNLLRDIIKLQGQVNRETEAALERQLEDIFGAD